MQGILITARNPIVKIKEKPDEDAIMFLRGDYTENIYGVKYFNVVVWKTDRKILKDRYSLYYFAKEKEREEGLSKKDGGLFVVDRKAYDVRRWVNTGAADLLRKAGYVNWHVLEFKKFRQGVCGMITIRYAEEYKSLFADAWDGTWLHNTVGMVVFNELYNRGEIDVVGRIEQYALEVTVPLNLERMLEKMYVSVKGVISQGQVLRIKLGEEHPLPGDYIKPDALGLVRRGGTYSVLWGEVAMQQGDLITSFRSLHEEFAEKVADMEAAGLVSGGAFTKKGVALVAPIADAESGVTAGHFLSEKLGAEEDTAYPRVESKLSHQRRALRSQHTPTSPVFVVYEKTEEGTSARFIYLRTWTSWGEVERYVKACYG